MPVGEIRLPVRVHVLGLVAAPRVLRLLLCSAVAAAADDVLPIMLMLIIFVVLLLLVVFLACMPKT